MSGDFVRNLEATRVYLFVADEEHVSLNAAFVRELIIRYDASRAVIDGLCARVAELAAGLHLRPGESPPPREECSGVSATWCPNHGYCTCRDKEDKNDEGCPLHGSASDHAEG